MRACLWVLLLLSGCAREPATQTLRLGDSRWQLELPVAWQLQRAERETLLFTRPAQEGQVLAGAYLMVVRNPQRQAEAAENTPEKILGSYVSFAEAQARHFASRYELLSSENLLLDSVPAVLQQRRLQGPAGEKREWALLWVHEAQGYQLTASAGAENSQQLARDYQRVAHSLHLEPL